MKYKNIDSAIHNFGQSFMSGMNYFQDDHVMYDVSKMAEKAEEKEISINFSTGEISHEYLATDRVKESIKYYMKQLPEHLSSHKIDLKSLNNIILSHRITMLGCETYMDAQDDRNTKHRVYVNPA